ncbi:MAG: 1-deoxy-D-xylulose-5-phosphate reductoisomerase [Coriobacteriales bacterium]|nr:1-deoxy-D-xylulose-5-phosphate reductoisomerase [Coriobacteriales bacterium]
MRELGGALDMRRASGPVRIALLGSTGSIGRQALEVARKHPQTLRVVALAAHRNVGLLAAQAAEFGVRHLALGDEALAASTQIAQLPADAALGFGAAAVEALATLEDVDVVLNALVGAAGLRASYTTLKQGRRLALANKESLVVGGDLIMPLATPQTLLPVDSEHSAIYQCLVGEDATEVSRIWLTASGGPFRGRSREQLASATSAEALAHPTWLMGPKITIDSATLMNKGLEAIEAHHLFAIEISKIKVVIHPQSCIHSMVEYRDGSVKAHLGATDMRIPIQYALSFPERWDAPLEPLDFTQLGQLTFEAPDYEVFGALRLALEAGRVGGTAPVVLNAANEVAVEAFLAGACGFTSIERIVATALEAHTPQPVTSLAQLEELDAQTRALARRLLSR